MGQLYTLFTLEDFLGCPVIISGWLLQVTNANNFDINSVMNLFNPF